MPDDTATGDDMKKLLAQQNKADRADAKPTTADQKTVEDN